MTKSALDEYCQEIFFFLLLYDKPIRFNEMNRKMNEPTSRMTTPTLIKHTKHLLTSKLIIRKRHGTQNATYEVNYERAEKMFKESPINRRVLVDTFENKKRFDSFDADEQAMLGSVVIALGSLQQLKLDILNIINPKDSFENTLKVLLSQRLYDLFRTWLLQSCRDSTEHAHQVLEAVERSIENLTKEFFVKMPEPARAS